MAAKRQPTLTEKLLLHMKATRRLEALLEEITALRDAGKLSEARRLMKDAEQLRARIETMEQHYRR